MTRGKAKHRPSTKDIIAQFLPELKADIAAAFGEGLTEAATADKTADQRRLPAVVAVAAVGEQQQQEQSEQQQRRLQDQPQQQQQQEQVRPFPSPTFTSGGASTLTMSLSEATEEATADAAAQETRCFHFGRSSSLSSSGGDGGGGGISDRPSSLLSSPPTSPSNSESVQVEDLMGALAKTFDSVVQSQTPLAALKFVREAVARQGGKKCQTFAELRQCLELLPGSLSGAAPAAAQSLTGELRWNAQAELGGSPPSFLTSAACLPQSANR